MTNENGADAPKNDDVRPAANDEAASPPNGDVPPKPGGQSGRRSGQRIRTAELLAICEMFPTFHAPDGEGYVKIDSTACQETLAIAGSEFRGLAERLYYRAHNEAAGKDAIDAAVSTLIMKARLDSPEEQVFVRVAAHGGNIYLDLADAQRRAVEITPTNWSVINQPPVRFLRPKSLRALPEPQRGGRIDEIRDFFNISDEHDVVLLIVWPLIALNPQIPCPMLVLTGGAGSAKSTSSRLLQQLIDPSGASLRVIPRDVKDVLIAATSSRVLPFDNISKLSPFMSDTFCRIVTGGSLTVRKLYTDRDEVSFVVKNPMILNGIGNFVDRSDLLDRSILITLRPIDETQRKTEQQIEAAFDAVHPRILGAICDALSFGLREHSTTRLPELPRMADAILWATACEGAFGWEKGTVFRAFKANQRKAVEQAVDGDPLSAAIYRLMQDQTVWRGTASRLLADLYRVMARTDEHRALPSGASALGQLLDRAATSLRKLDITIERFPEGKRRERIILITRRELNDADPA